MKLQRTDDARRTAVIRLLVLIASAGLWISLLAPHSLGQRKKDSRDEVFETVDPYTGGTREGLDRAGYVSLGPFPWCEGVRTEDIEEAVGRRLLWVETAHFKIGSTLETYRTKGDKKEDKKLVLEIERLTPRLGATKITSSKLDPWLRLHLYAQRLEDAYASFLETFAVDEADFKKPIDRWNPMGDGPYLGQPMKFTVLLFEKQSSQGRYMSRYMKREAQCSVRERLPGGSLLLVTNAEVLRSFDLDLDAALHCAVIADTTLNMVDGFRNSWSAPFWFKQGLAHAASRRIDERWTLFAAGTMRDKTDSWKWEPRVFGLVTNGYAPSWKTMSGWTRWEDLDAVGHMVCWSRVTWLLSRKDANVNGFLMDLTQPLPANSSADHDSIVLQRQDPALKKAFGKDGAELDAAWREFVTSTYRK